MRQARARPPKSPAHQLLLSYLDQKLPRRGPVALDLSGSRLAIWLLSHMDNIPRRELARVLEQLQTIAGRSFLAASLLRTLIVKIQGRRREYIH